MDLNCWYLLTVSYLVLFTYNWQSCYREHGNIYFGVLCEVWHSDSSNPCLGGSNNYNILMYVSSENL